MRGEESPGTPPLEDETEVGGVGSPLLA